MERNKIIYGGETLIDLTDATATASDILSGKTAYGADGSLLIGTATPGSGGGVIQDQEGAIVLPAEGSGEDTGNTYETGSFTLAERTFSVTIDVGITDFRYLLLWTPLTALQKTGVKYNTLIFSDFQISRSSWAVQNNSGTDWLWHNGAFTSSYAKVTKSGTSVTIANTNSSVTGTTIGYFRPLTYTWLAWGELS